MSKKAKQYSAAEKSKIVIEAIKGELTTAQISSKYWVHSTQMSIIIKKGPPILTKKGPLIFKILLSFYITSPIIIFDIFSSITWTINSKNYRMMAHPV